ncbi:tRNA pseudouridine(13) synthase TruD [soil metagenome]
MTLDPLSPLPFLTAGLPGIGGRIKEQPEDFEVEEIPAYEPSGEGEFLYLWVEKRDMGAEYFVRTMARRLDIPTGEIGTAGLKDRRAVTRQMVSLPGAVEGRLAQLEGDGIRVLKVGRHSNKLRAGHLHGNRFTILIRDVVANTPDILSGILEALGRQGFPNFYGPQRFGKDGETAKLGMSLLTGDARGSRRLSPFMRKLAVSAAQSLLFNRWLENRMKDGLFQQALVGDVMTKLPHGGLFVVDDQPAEQARFDRHEIVYTGPMFGRKLFASAAVASERESAILQESGLELRHFFGFGKLLSGTRRAAVVYPDDLQAEIIPEGVKLRFVLPSGCYATVLLNELMKTSLLDGDELA